MTTAADRWVFALPDLGEGLTEGEVLNWQVAVGSIVKVDQVVVEVETAKAVVEVPVPYAGIVLELHADVGTVLEIGAPLVSIGRVASAVSTEERQFSGGSDNVMIGFGTNDAPRVISPLVRSLAPQHGIDVANLSPSAPHGVILRCDVEQEIAKAAQPVATKPPVPVPGTVKQIPLRGRLRTAAEKLSHSSAVPSATTWIDVDATDLLQAREVLSGSPPERRIGLLVHLARICVTGLRRLPELNSSVDLEQAQISRFSGINLGSAVQTGNGLLVPVVHGAHLMTIAGLATEMNRLISEAQADHLQPGTLVGGTLTLNNYGALGVDGAVPLINYPEAAMLGVGRIISKPWVFDGQLAIRKVTQFTLTFDHRVCDGGTAAGFLRYVADCVERTAVLLADL